MAYKFDEIVGSTEICTKAEIQPIILGINSDITTLQSNLTTLGNDVGDLKLKVCNLETSMSQACNNIIAACNNITSLSCAIGCINSSLACKLGCVIISGESPIVATNNTSSQTTASYTISLASGLVIPTTEQLGNITSQLSDLQGINHIVGVDTDPTCLTDEAVHELSAFAGLEYGEFTYITDQHGQTRRVGGTHVSGSLYHAPDAQDNRYDIYLCTAEGFTVPNTYDVIQIHHAKRILGGTTILTSDSCASSTTAADQLYTVDDFRNSLCSAYYNSGNVGCNITIPNILNALGCNLTNRVGNIAACINYTDRIAVETWTSGLPTIYGCTQYLHLIVCSGYQIPTETRYNQIAYNEQILGGSTTISNEYGCYTPACFQSTLSAANSYFASNPPSTVISALSRLADSITQMVPGFELSVVSSLPSTGTVGIMYLVPDDSAENPNVYNEYLWISAASKFERIGTTETTISSFVEKAKVGAIDDLSSIQSATSSTTLGQLKDSFNDLVNYLRNISVITSTI